MPKESGSPGASGSEALPSARRGAGRPGDRADAPRHREDAHGPHRRCPWEGIETPANLGSWRALLLLVALLLGAVLLGGLAWALSRGPSEQGTPGAGRVEVPDVVGLSRDEATKRLEGAGLKLGSQAEAPNGEFAEGAVIDQDPAAGTEAVRGTAVDLVVSTGPAQELTPPASLSATPAASPTATATATAPPASNAEAKKRREEQRKEAAKEAEERQKEREKELKQAQEEAREDE